MVLVPMLRCCRCSAGGDFPARLRPGGYCPTGLVRLQRYGGHQVRYLSDVNLRAVLNVLISRAGGSVEISSAELYDAMLPDSGESEIFAVEETASGVRLSLVHTESDDR
jgi:hypothetical protein